MDQNKDESKITMEVTPVEHDIIADLRRRKPFEEIRIVKDRLGAYDSYMVYVTEKKLYKPEISSWQSELLPTILKSMK